MTEYEIPEEAFASLVNRTTCVCGREIGQGYLAVWRHTDDFDMCCDPTVGPVSANIATPERTVAGP